MNLKRWVLLSLALALAAVFCVPQVPAQTQTTGEITGVVTDPSGAVVAAAKVTLTDNAKGTTLTAVTNKDGIYHFQLLNPSNYTVAVRSSGFQETKKILTVALGQVATGDVQLMIGSPPETVNVTGGAEPLLQTENGNVATTFDQQQLSETPHPGNDLTAI